MKPGRNLLVLASSLFFPFVAALSSCGDDETRQPDPEGCDTSALVFEVGSAEGHADPFGARAAGQARAGKILASQVPQPKHGKFKVEDGDYVLVNDRIAVVIEGKDVSDGYGRFGGEILALDRVGADGKPIGRSYFVETLNLISLYMVDPDSVTVLADGSDGGAAIVRVAGPLKPLPFLNDTFGAAFPKTYADHQAIVDYVLSPGAEKIVVRYGIANPDPEFDIDTGLNFDGSFELFGFFQTSFNRRFVPGTGFGEPDGMGEFVAFDNAEIPFAYQGPGGTPLEYGGVSQSGFELFGGEGMVARGCTADVQERFEIVVGEPGEGLDGLRRVVQRANGKEAWREITGRVTDSEGRPLEGAFVHALDAAGKYLVRVETDSAGGYRLQAPPGQAVTLVPSKSGFPHHDGVSVGASSSSQDLALDANGFLRVSAVVDGSTRRLPVRIQVISTVPEMEWPAAFGILPEDDGRLHVEYAVDGQASFAVPPGEHRVVVSRGYEWEIHDQTVQVAAGEVVSVGASLVHSVDTTGSMSADFHIHSQYSADSADPVDFKVRGCVAEGLDIPVSSEHEWVVDFQPSIEAYGLEDWARGLPSEELTTFTWGHFGVVPILPRPGELNNGARDWLGKSAKEVFADVDALPEQPALIVNHPSGDAGFSAYFTAVSLDRTTGSSTDPLWDENFDAIEVFNDSDFESNRHASVADWFALLNAGKTFWAVGSSDSHHLRTSPVGYPRTYLLLGYDDPRMVTPEDVRDAIKQGRSTIGAGLFMSVVGPSESGPGDTVAGVAGQADFTVTVRAPSWVVADSLEIIVDGTTVATEPLEPVGVGPGQTFVNQVTVDVPAGRRSWVLFHAKGGGDLAPVHPGKEPFAVSNPVFFAP